MNHPYISIADHDGVAVLTLDRPPANAMDVDLLEQVVAAVTELDHARPKAVVLAGQPGIFSAGADLKAVPGYGPDEQRRSVAGINAMALGVYSLPCPVVGAITGHAIAGGWCWRCAPTSAWRRTPASTASPRSRSATPTRRRRSASSRPS